MPWDGVCVGSTQAWSVTRTGTWDGMVSTMVKRPSRCVMGISILYTKTSDSSTSSHVLQPIPSPLPHYRYALNPQSVTRKGDLPAAGMGLGALGVELAGCLAVWGGALMLVLSIHQPERRKKHHGKFGIYHGMVWYGIYHGASCPCLCNCPFPTIP